MEENALVLLHEEFGTLGIHLYGEFVRGDQLMLDGLASLHLDFKEANLNDTVVPCSSSNNGWDCPISGSYKLNIDSALLVELLVLELCFRIMRVRLWLLWLSHYFSIFVL